MSDAVDARVRLLDSAMEYMAENGVGERSLRQIAAALGTSHRMLIYHFGSKEGLLVEIVKVMEERQRAVFAELDADDGTLPADVARRFWRRLVEPQLWPYERLFFEMIGRALQGDAASRSLLDGIVDAWMKPLTSSLERAGIPRVKARALARAGLAAARGLLLDLLATGEREAVDEAMEEVIGLFEYRIAGKGPA